MGLKSWIDKSLAYFDVDSVSEVTEETEAQQASPKRPEPQPRAVAGQRRVSQPVQAEQRPAAVREERPVRPQPTVAAPKREEVMRPERPGQVTTDDARVTIALKYPRQYEDAQEIVDLLLKNECVLIDFQYMLEAQARRCIDFIDGASKVLFGNLKKVGSSMYLLTPGNVALDLEEVAPLQREADSGFDFDMKRR